MTDECIRVMCRRWRLFNPRLYVPFRVISNHKPGTYFQQKHFLKRYEITKISFGKTLLNPKVQPDILRLNMSYLSWFDICIIFLILMKGVRVLGEKDEKILKLFSKLNCSIFMSRKFPQLNIQSEMFNNDSVKREFVSSNSCLFFKL